MDLANMFIMIMEHDAFDHCALVFTIGNYFFPDYVPLLIYINSEI